MIEAKRSFYQFLMTHRDPHKKDELTSFANAAQYDGTFPKQSSDYEEITRYLETSSSYLPSMTVFDEAWNMYKEENQII